MLNPPPPIASPLTQAWSPHHPSRPSLTSPLMAQTPPTPPLAQARRRPSPLPPQPSRPSPVPSRLGSPPRPRHFFPVTPSSLPPPPPYDPRKEVPHGRQRPPENTTDSLSRSSPIPADRKRLDTAESLSNAQTPHPLAPNALTPNNLTPIVNRPRLGTSDSLPPSMLRPRLDTGDKSLPSSSLPPSGPRARLDTTDSAVTPPVVNNASFSCPSRERGIYGAQPYDFVRSHSTTSGDADRIQNSRSPAFDWSRDAIDQSNRTLKVSNGSHDRKTQTNSKTSHEGAGNLDLLDVDDPNPGPENNDGQATPWAGDREMLQIGNRSGQQHHRRSSTLDLLDVTNPNPTAAHDDGEGAPTPLAHNRTPARLADGDREELLKRLIHEQTDDEKERLLRKLLQEKEGRENDFREQTVGANRIFLEEAAHDDNFNDEGSVVFNDERGVGIVEEKEHDVKVAQDKNMTERSLDADTLAENSNSMKIFPKSQRDDDASSDVSSLTDAVSYQQEKKEARRKKKEAKIKTDRSVAIPSGQEKPGTTAASLGPMAALSRWPKSLRRVVSTRNRIGTPDNKDTATTTATSIGHSLDNRTPHTLETIDNSLEQHLYEYGSKKNLFDFTSKRDRLQYGNSEKVLSQKNKPPMLFPSLLGESMLGESINHEKTSVRNLKSQGGGGGSQTGHRRWFTVPTDEGRTFQTSGSGYHRRMTSEGSDQAGGVRHRRLTSNGSELDGSIQSSWLMSCPTSAAQQLNSPGGAEFTQMETHAMETPRPLEAGEDMIDVSHDEPVDPFSGLIGMPRTAGCGSIVSGDESPGWNVFGTFSSSFSLGKSPTESTPGSVNDEESDAHIPSSCAPGSRPQIVHRRSKSALHVDEFDPLSLDGMLESSPSITTSSAGSPLRTPAPIPPRHLRDDPMLSKSRYRLPLAPGQQHERRSSKKSQKTKKKKKSPMTHRRSSSLDAAGAGNACMFGNVAQLEMNRSPQVITTALTSINRIRNTSCESLEWGDVSISPSHGRSLGDGASTGQQESIALETPGSLQSEGASMARTPSSQVEAVKTPKLDEKENGDDDGDDNSSYGSFSEEYHRPEQKRKIVAKEMKHIIGRVLPMGKPVVKVGRKLLGREKEEAAIKRSEGCLT